MRFASLTAGLLARKGEAHPASTATFPEDMLVRSRQGWTSPWQEKTEAGKPAPASVPEPPTLKQAEPQPKPQPQPRQESADEPCMHAQACQWGDAPTAAPDPLKRFHVSVRLKRGHYIRLKLASAQLHKPSQEIIAEALADWYARQDESLFGQCACLNDDLTALR